MFTKKKKLKLLLLKKINNMKNKFLFIIILIVASFIWFEIRPAIIRKNCYQSANRDKNQYNSFASLYTGCLITSGLDAEILP